MDLFAPCNFGNIQSQPHDLPKSDLDKMPTFQGNNAISVEAHLGAFTIFLIKHNSRGVYNHVDIKMKLFVLSLEEVETDWLLDKPYNSFDSLQAIINAFKDKYGDKREGRYLLRTINNIKKNENETVDEFNKKFNGIDKEMPQDYKPTDKSLLEYYLDAFRVDTSYELRRAKTNDLNAAQNLAEELEKDKKASGKSEIPGFERGPTKDKGKEVKEVDRDPIKELTQLIRDMKIEQDRLNNTLLNALLTSYSCHPLVSPSLDCGFASSLPSLGPSFSVSPSKSRSLLPL